MKLHFTLDQALNPQLSCEVIGNCKEPKKGELNPKNVTFSRPITRLPYRTPLRCIRHFKQGRIRVEFQNVCFRKVLS